MEMTTAPTCPVCDMEKNRKTFGGIAQLGCMGCKVRRIAGSPKHIREAAYAAIEGQAERDEFKRAVEAEYRRVKAIT